VNLLVAKRIIINDNRINPKRFAIEEIVVHCDPTTNGP